MQRIEAFHNLEQAYDQLLGRIGVQTGLTRSDKVESELPEKYSYYQMLGISDISQVNIDNIRAANDVTVSMKVPRKFLLVLIRKAKKCSSTYIRRAMGLMV